MPNWKKLIVSGSDASLNSLTVATNVNAQSFTGSLFGTASWAQNASTSSYVLNAISSSFAQTASFVNPLSQNVSLNGTLNVTGSVNISGSTGNVFTANIDTIAFTGSFLQSGSVNVNGSVTATNFTGSLFGTASWASNAITASYVLNAVSASFATSASYSLSSSYALTASYAKNIEVSGAITNVDYIDFDTSVNFTNTVGRLGWDSGDYNLQLGLTGSNVQLAMGEQMYQYVFNAEGTTITKGQVVYISGSQGNRIAVKLASNNAEYGSANSLGFAAESIAAGGTGWVITEGNLKKLNTLGLTAGELVYLGSTPGTYTQTPPTAPSHSVRLGYVERVSATVGTIYVKIDNGYELGELHNIIDNSTTSSYGDLLVKSGSVWINSKQLTGSYGLTGSLSVINGGITSSLEGTSSFAIQSITSSYADSFTVKNNAVVSGSLTILQNLTVFGSASITYITQSTLDIATNLITVNTNTPGVRFGGLAVIDSGSVPQKSGSWLFDSVEDRWLFIHQQPAGSALTSSIGIMGPETYNDLGNEITITLNRLTKGYSGASGEHIGDSQITDDGTTVSIPGNLTVTGSITGQLTGSLFGTSSWSQNALVALTASYAATASSAALFNLSSSLYSAQGSSIGAGTTAVVSISTGSYKAGFFDYTVYNTGNARAGTVMSAWNGSTVTYTDNSTTDIGTTNSVTMSVALNGGNVELRTTAGTTWTVNTTYRLI